MKYSANTFLDDLKEADRVKSKRFRSKCSSKKKAYSDGDVKDVAEEILTIAENYGDYYSKKDAKGAIHAAKMEYIKYTTSNIYNMAREAAKIALKDLEKEWK